MSGLTVLVVLLLMGIVARSHLITIAVIILLVLKLINFQFVFPVLEKRGLEIGLLFLILSILVPLASGKVSGQEIKYNFSSLSGLIAIAGGALATHLNGQGLKLLQVEPEIIFGLVTGSVFGIIFLDGIPVGPLMAAGVSALFLELTSWFKR